MHVNNNNIIWSNYTFDIQANQTQYEKLHWYESACKSRITRGLFKPKKSIIDFVGLNSVSEPAMKLLFALMDSGLPKRKSKFIVYFVSK